MVQVECTTVAFTFMSFSTTSTWLVVVMTFDRCVAVVKPLYQPEWRSPKHSGILIAAVFIFCSAMNIPYSFTSKVCVV